MTIDWEIPIVRLVLGAALLLAAACQQGPATNAVDAVGANDAAANGPAANQSASGAGTGTVPHPVTMERDPANQTGPVARAIDADFPEPCQAYVRDTQACIDALDGAEVTARTRELRLQLHSNRSTWLRVQDRAGLISICRDNLGMLRERRREYRC